MKVLDLAIAKIEGIFDEKSNCIVLDETYFPLDIYTPSTDWNWCGPLIEKYKVNIHYDGGDAWFAWFEPDSPTSEGKTPQEAICRAIMEVKHETKS